MGGLLLLAIRKEKYGVFRRDALYSPLQLNSNVGDGVEVLTNRFKIWILDLGRIFSPLILSCLLGK